MEEIERYNRLFALYSRIIYEKIRDTKAEVDFLTWAFRNLARREVNTVLDVACGTGRHALPLSQLGYKVVGIDLSRQMLSCCAESDEGDKVGLVQGDMRLLPFKGDVFDAMFCMFSSFNHLVRNEDIISALRSFRSSLKPGGVLILDLISPFKFFRLGFRLEEVHECEKNGIQVRRILNHHIDEVEAIWYQSEHAVIKAGSQVMENRETHPVRLLSYPEMRHLLEEVGFEGIRCFGSFRDREVAVEKADRLIILALKGG